MLPASTGREEAVVERRRGEHSPPRESASRHRSASLHCWTIRQVPAEAAGGAARLFHALHP
eukprot:12915743-Prorocentrum_lima.AAC.1